MRTGSTVLSEALTQIPYAFIFREPHLGKNDFRLKPDDISRFGQQGQKMAAFTRLRLPLAFCLRRLRPFGYPQDFMVKQFKRHLIPHLGVRQVGVKEIKNRGWRNYHKHFPGMKVIITARDPRDIYLSLYHRVRKGSIRGFGPVTPDSVSQEILAQFEHQRQMQQTCDTLPIRYEDLCTDDDVYERTKQFVRSPIPDQGKIGAFNARHRRRADEYELHGNEITDLRINRWRHEENASLVKDAQEVFERMKSYTDFWGYE